MPDDITTSARSHQRADQKMGTNPEEERGYHFLRVFFASLKFFILLFSIFSRILKTDSKRGKSGRTHEDTNVDGGGSSRNIATTSKKVNQNKPIKQEFVEMQEKSSSTQKISGVHKPHVSGATHNTGSSQVSSSSSANGADGNQQPKEPNEDYFFTDDYESSRIDFELSLSEEDDSTIFQNSLLTFDEPKNPAEKMLPRAANNHSSKNSSPSTNINNIRIESAANKDAMKSNLKKMSMKFLQRFTSPQDQKSR